MTERVEVPSPSSAFPLVTTLLLRGCMNAAFAVWLIRRASDWVGIFEAGAVYALADGALGFLMAALLVRHRPITAPPALASLVFADAITRVGVGAAIGLLPGIPQLPITVVLFFGALGSWAASAGVIAMIAWLVAHHRERAGRPRSSTDALFGPLAAAGLIALGLALYAFIVGPPATFEELRTAAGTAAGALTIVFLVASVSVARLRGRTV